YTRSGDLTSGRLFPYLKNKPVYMCPTDQLNLAGYTGPRTGPPSPIFGNGNSPRDYSYAMNCGLCHESDPAKFLAPTRTMVYMEAALARNDYSGQVGPAIATHALSTRHNNRGFLTFGDSHLEKINSRTADKLERSKRFWFPTTDLSGPGGMSFNLNLPDP